MITLHLIDPATPEDALTTLATLIARSSGIQHHVLILGHLAIAQKAVRLGIPATLISKLFSAGWADPIGWCALRQVIRQLHPTHLHAWGLRGIVAAAVQSSFTGARLATLTVAPTERQMKLLRAAQSRAPFAWIASSSSVSRSLLSRGLEKVSRIRPGISMAEEKSSTITPQETRKLLGIKPDQGPVILVGGEPSRAGRQDHALWSIGILNTLSPRTRAIVRLGHDTASDHLRDFVDVLVPGCDPAGLAAVAPEEMSWDQLARAADIFLITPEAPIPVGSIFSAMTAGTPVIGTATSEVSELIEHGRSGLLAIPGKPRSIASRLEEFMSDSRLRWPLTDSARTDVYAHFKPRFMAESYRAVYTHTLTDPRLTKPIDLPLPDLTAADRFAGIVATA